MQLHLVYAHPTADSFNAALRDETIASLEQLGHTAIVSDLYAMKWKAAADHDDLGPTDADSFIEASAEAYASGAMSADIRAEHERLLASDALILQFPLWWFSMPAIMKGWVDRVFTNGFGYSSGRGWKRYGDGVLRGKRAMVSVTAGAGTPQLSPRGINGDIDDLLFPIQHGILYYTGMAVLPPFVVPGVGREEPFDAVAARLRERLAALETTEPIAYRPQAGGDYAEGVLKPGRERPGATGFGLHTA